MPSPTYNTLLRGLPVKNGVRLMVVLPFVLVSICLGMPDLASALTFDSFSLTGFVAPIPGTSRAAATFTATAQDFSLQIGVRDQEGFLQPADIARIGCFGSDIFGPPIPCRPGERVSAFASQGGSNEDLRTSMVLAGQVIPGCDAGGHPITGEGTLCVSGHLFGLGWGSAVLPPFAGVPADTLNVTTVASTFSVADVGASIIQGNRSIASVDFGGFGIGPPLSGPAQFDLQWQPDTGTWLPLFAEGRIDVAATPEPPTLLLVATTAVGFCAARYRRRHDAQRGES